MLIADPIIADGDRAVASLYGMLDQTNITAEGLPLTVRSVFFIGRDKSVRGPRAPRAWLASPPPQVKAIITYPASTGRNFNEILRVLDSLRLTDDHKVATPANWKDGDYCVIVPSVSDVEAKTRCPKGWDAKTPYLRLTPQPNKE